MDIFMKLLTHPLAISLLPLCFSGWCTFIIVQAIKRQRRDFQRKRPLFPIEALSTMGAIGLILGGFFQWGTAELIAVATGWNTFGWKGIIVAGVGTPFVAWGWYEHLLRKYKDDPVALVRLKVPHIYNVHNTDMDGDGVNDYIPSDQTLVDMASKLKRGNINDK